MSCVHTACSAAAYAKRCRTAQGRAGGGQHGEDGDSGAGAGGHVGDGHEKLALAASLTTSLSCLHLRPKAMRVSMARVARAGEGCVPAAQCRRMPERALGLLLTSGGWWVGLGSKAAHERPRTQHVEGCGRRGGERVYLWH